MFVFHDGSGQTVKLNDNTKVTKWTDWRRLEKPLEMKYTQCVETFEPFTPIY